MGLFPVARGRSNARFVWSASCVRAPGVSVQGERPNFRLDRTGFISFGGLLFNSDMDRAEGGRRRGRAENPICCTRRTALVNCLWSRTPRITRERLNACPQPAPRTFCSPHADRYALGPLSLRPRLRKRQPIRRRPTSCSSSPMTSGAASAATATTRSSHPISTAWRPRGALRAGVLPVSRLQPEPDLVPHGKAAGHDGSPG